jgi:hypothetical protein
MSDGLKEHSSRESLHSKMTLTISNFLILRSRGQSLNIFTVSDTTKIRVLPSKIRQTDGKVDR